MPGLIAWQRPVLTHISTSGASANGEPLDWQDVEEGEVTLGPSPF